MRVRDLGQRPASASLRQLFGRMVRGHAPAVSVVRRPLPYWQERGWTRNGREFAGNYQTAYAAFSGFAMEHSSGHLEFFLYAPSEEIRRHSHWTCFVDRKDGWYMVHMGRQPKDLSSGIMTIERLIAEAYES